MEKQDNDLIIEGNSVYEVDKNCLTKLKSSGVADAVENHNDDLLSLLIFMLIIRN